MTFCLNSSGPSTRIYIVKFVCNKIKRRRKLLSRIVFCWLQLDIAWQQQTITSYCLWMFTRMFLWTWNYLFHLIFRSSVIYIDKYMLYTLLILRWWQWKKEILCILKFLKWLNVKFYNNIIMAGVSN